MRSQYIIGYGLFVACEGVVEIGTPPWSRAEMVAELEPFIEIYGRRPIQDNEGGMKAPHMFALWFMLRRLEPDLVVESGVWKGQSTWLIEEACPKAEIVSIDPDLRHLVYRSERSQYFQEDFSRLDWTRSTERAVAFFDDHQNAYHRIQQCHWFGFRHVIFEDNYPPGRGDCYSLKQAFAGAGPEMTGQAAPARKSWLERWRRGPSSHTPTDEAAPGRPQDRDMLHRRIDVYAEFPPVVRVDRTRWGDAWTSERYPTPAPLLSQERGPEAMNPHRVYEAEAAFYTWMAYVRLR